MWGPLKTAVTQLADTVNKYIQYLRKSSDRFADHSERLDTVSNTDQNQSVTVIFPKYVVKPSIASRYKALTDHLGTLDNFQPLCIDEYTPGDTRQRRFYIDNIKHGLSYKCIYFRITAGNNIGSHNFLWHIPSNKSENEILPKNMDMIRKLTQELPTYHTRTMRRRFV